MAHKTGRKFKKLGFNKPGWGIGKFGKSLNFGDVATIASFASGIGGLGYGLSSLGAGGVAGGAAGAAGAAGAGTAAAGTAAAGAAGSGGLMSSLMNYGPKALGLLSTMGGGGGPPQYDITGGAGSDMYENMTDNWEKQQLMADDMMDPGSDYNVSKKNDLKDLISFGNTMGARNMAKSGMNVSGSNILSENLQGNMNTALNKYNENIPKNLQQSFGMLSGINQQQMPMYENLVNQDIANQNRNWQQGQNNQSGWLDLGLGLLDYYNKE